MPFLQFIMAGKNRVSQVKTSEMSQSAIIKTFFWTSKKINSISDIRSCMVIIPTLSNNTYVSI